MKNFSFSFLIIFMVYRSFGAQQQSVFSYQGRLSENGASANGAFDFRFILYNAEFGGSQVGGVLFAEDISVSNSLFTASLDFGETAFVGQARWLEIAVRPGNSTNQHFTLSPRQAITATPNALFAVNAANVPPGSITAASLAPYSVTGAAIAPGAITTDKISSAAVTLDKLADSVLTGIAGVPRGGIVLSTEEASTNLSSAGYSKLGGYKLLAPDWETLFSSNSPTSLRQVSAIWTGTEAIVWGGNDSQDNVVNRGFRYRVSSNDWVPTSQINVPESRRAHTVIWTGSEMIVWGGFGQNLVNLNSGGRYHPATDTWVGTTTANAPSGRIGHKAIWTGSEMLVWGGFIHSNGFITRLNTGSSYTPSNNQWRAISTNGVPSPRGNMFAAWTGTEMLIWGGQDDSGNSTSTGGRYNPATDSWTPMTIVNAPASAYVAPDNPLWTGTDLLYWESSGLIAKRYNLQSNAWSTMGNYGPELRLQVWTGQEVIRLSFGNVAHLSLSNDLWRVYGSADPAPPSDMAFWTGSEVLTLSSSSPHLIGRYMRRSPLYLYLKP